MKIITSPAKLMDVSFDTNLFSETQPTFIKEAEHIQNHLKNKTPKFLSELMEISPKLADENWQRNQNWKSNPLNAESAPALFAFTGEVYRGLDANSLSDNALHYLQANYRILSGLYGLLKPSDTVMLYRLEMGRKFEFDGHKNLYEYWSEKVTNLLNKELLDDEFLLNLASHEYSKVVNRKKLNATVMDVDFQELKDGKLKTIVVYTKHARGLLVRYCAENNVNTLDEVKAFNLERYRIDEERSTDKKLVFTR